MSSDGPARSPTEKADLSTEGRRTVDGMARLYRSLVESPTPTTWLSESDVQISFPGRRSPGGTWAHQSPDIAYRRWF